MNILPREKQIEAVAALTEGVSVRATERLTGVNRGTILSLGVRVGQGRAALHDRLMRDLKELFSIGRFMHSTGFCAPWPVLDFCGFGISPRRQLPAP